MSLIDRTLHCSHSRSIPCTAFSFTLCAVDFFTRRRPSNPIIPSFNKNPVWIAAAGSVPRAAVLFHLRRCVSEANRCQPHFAQSRGSQTYAQVQALPQILPPRSRRYHWAKLLIFFVTLSRRRREGGGDGHIAKKGKYVLRTICSRPRPRRLSPAPGSQNGRETEAIYGMFCVVARS